MTENSHDYKAHVAIDSQETLQTRVSGFADINFDDGLLASNEDCVPASFSAQGAQGAACAETPKPAPWQNPQRIRTLAVKLNLPEDRVVAALETMAEEGA